MTTATFSRLPLSAGGAIAGSLAKGGYWTLSRLVDVGALAARQFMRAPVAISVVAAIAALSVLAGANALYFQTSRHPAPLFFAPVKADVPAVKPVIPATRPRPQQQSQLIDNDTTGSLGTAPSTAAIGNGEVLALQKKLAALGMFDGTADGLFGRRTINAIKAFEMKTGHRPRGLLTREVLTAVLAAPLPAPQPLPAATTTVASLAPAPLPRQVVSDAPAAKPVIALAPAGKPVPLVPLPQAVAPAPQALAPLPPAVAPQPAADTANTFDSNSLPAESAAPAPAQQAAQPLPAAEPQPLPQIVANHDRPSPDSLLDAAGDTAASAFDTVASALADVADTRTGLPKRSAPPARTPVAAPPTALAQASAPTAADTLAPAAGTTTVAMNNVPAKPAVAAAAPLADTGSLTPAQRLAAQMGTLPPEATAASTATPMTVASAGDSEASTDPVLITKIQRGLASLGFLGARIDGVPGEGTAKAIRNFEVFYDYKVTGQASQKLLNLLLQHGAVI